jgi:hypothetical protein
VIVCHKWNGFIRGEFKRNFVRLQAPWKYVFLKIRTNRIRTQMLYG